MRIIGIILILTSLVIGFGSLQIFFSFAHTQMLPTIACGETVANSVPPDVKTEYEKQCLAVNNNVKKALNVSMDKSAINGILAFLLLLLGLVMAVSKPSANTPKSN